MPCGLSVYSFLRIPAFAALIGMQCLASAWAQPAPPASSPTSGASPVTPEVVPLDFAIRTKSGKPVLGLKPSDLLLTDNGSAVPLNSLRFVTGTDGQDRLVTLVFDSLDVAPAQAARKLAEKILGQFPQTGYSFAVMDIAGGLASSPATILPPGPDVRQISAPDANLAPQSGIETTPGLHLLQNYTTSRNLLRKAINQAAGGEGVAQPAATLTPAEEQLTAFARQSPGAAHAEDLDRAESMLSALNESRRPSEGTPGTSPGLSALLALVRSQRAIAGRKIILYFAQGLPADDDSLNMVGSVIAEANRSEVSIVTVDVELGMTLDVQPATNDTGANLLAAGATLNRAYGYGVATSNRPARNDPLNPYSADFTRFIRPPAPDQTGENTQLNSGAAGPPNPLALLAAATGGVSFTPAKIKRDLRQLREELTDYYEASYTPKLTRYDGEFHPLTIQARRRNLVLRSRAGYFALPPDSSSGMRLFEVPLLAILSSPRLPTEIAYHAQVLHLGQFASKPTGELVVEVPVAQLQTRADADTNLSSAHLAIVMQVRNAKGEVLARFSEDILRRRHADLAQLRNAAFSGSQPAATDRDAIVMERPFAAEPGDYTLETAVLDEFGNKAAAQRITFAIAPSQPQLQLSDLTLVRRIDPLHDTQSLEPMRYKNGRVVPDLTAVLPEDTDHVSFFVLVHLVDATQPHLTLRILREAKQVSQIPLAPAAGTAASGGSVFPWLGTIQASAFPPGHYQLQATLSQSGYSATASASFVVEGKHTASAPVAFTAVSGEADPDRDLPAERRLTESAALRASGLSISSPANPLPPPTPAEFQALVESARQRALAWTDSLPNFLCVETTSHSLYSRSSASWQPSDTAVQLMRYLDHAEARTLVELNGRRRDLPSQVEFAHSTGEFGGALRGIFDPSARTQFTWKQADLLDGDLVEVLSYRVPRATSTFDASNELHDAFVAFHGLVWIDAATHNIRRITETLDDIPRNVGIRAASVSIDYAWVSIDRHEYMLPVHGAMSVLRGRHQAELNQFAFTQYHRFGSEVRMLPLEPAQTSLTH